MNTGNSCDAVMASQTASDFKKSFICAGDQLHEAMLNSPLSVLVYAFGVLLMMGLVKRATSGNRRKAGPKD
ncbi:MAG: hypothetical protein ACPH66_10205 [Candidatus Puniceispirillaceae bacterium]